MQTWNAVELRRFLDHVADDRMSAAWLLLAMTGMRRGEALGLRWRSVDLDSARVSVNSGRFSGQSGHCRVGWWGG